MKSMIQFCKKEAVLSIAVVLALLSVFFVRPDAGYHHRGEPCAHGGPPQCGHPLPVRPLTPKTAISIGTRPDKTRSKLFEYLL